MASTIPLNGLHIRKAVGDDLARLGGIHIGAYPDSRSAEARRRNFEANVFGDLDDLYVVARGERLLGSAILYVMQSWFGGRAVRFGGIAGVAVAAEARRQGLARALLDHLHAVSFARGDAITLLYPFRQGYYRRFGYGPATPMHQLTIAPSAVPTAWIRAAACGAIRSLEQGDRDKVARVYERVAAQKAGWLARRPLLWERGFLDEQRSWFMTENERGYISWTAEQVDYGPTRLMVHELVAEDDATWRTLWGHLGAQKDQATWIEITVPQDDPALFALSDSDAHRQGSPRIEHPLGIICGGPMVRVHDIPAALEARGYIDDAAQERTLVFAVGEPPVAARRIVVEGGAARVIETGDPVELFFSDTGVLASVAYGGIRPSQVARTGLVSARDHLVLERADHLFSTPAFDALDPF